jgi:hypothetical protein
MFFRGRLDVLQAASLAAQTYETRIAGRCSKSIIQDSEAPEPTDQMKRQRPNPHVLMPQFP